MNRLIYFLPLAVLVILAILLCALLQKNLMQIQQPPAVEVDMALPDFKIPGLVQSDIKGASLLHITASWCAVCKIENPLLLELGKKIPIYGIAWKDKPEALQAWLKQAGNPYQKIGFDEGMLGLELGISGTPESFLISKDRRIIAHFKGPLTPEQIEHDILARLK